MQPSQRADTPMARAMSSFSIVAVWMVAVNEKQFKHLRRLVGLPYMQGSKEFPPEPPASAEEVAAFMKTLNPWQWALVGYGIPVVVLWLMVFKPF